MKTMPLGLICAKATLTLTGFGKTSRGKSKSRDNGFQVPGLSASRSPEEPGRGKFHFGSAGNAHWLAC